MTAPKKLFLVDGSNQAFRAFFAIKGDLRNDQGFPTGALFGFANMLRKTLRDEAPDFMAVMFDVGPSFRNDLFPDYKGHRPDMPEDLRLQWPEFQGFCQDWGVFATAMPGYEADDVIGTLAHRYASDELQVTIVSNDKDLAQLVNDNVRLLRFGRDGEQIMGAVEVEAKFGVPPNKIVELLSLMGDKSDNVPGVPGVGPKKAAQFIQRFGTAEAVVSGAAEIGGKTGERVAESAAAVTMARRLVQLELDAPLTFKLDDIAVREPDWVAMSARLKRYRFRRMLSWANDHLGDEARTAPSINRSTYRTVQDVDALAALVRDLRSAGRFAFDTETTSLNPLEAALVGMSFAWGDGHAVYVPIAHVDGPNCPGAIAALEPLLADPSVRKTGQNLKYDLKVLRSNGLELGGIDGDTMLADYCVAADERQHGLDALAARYLDHSMLSYAETTKEVDGEFARVSVAAATQYAAEDAHVVLLLEAAMSEGLGAVSRVYRELEVPLIPVLADMELTGIGVDVAQLQDLSEELGSRIAAIEQAVYAEAGQEFNMNSPKQLAPILFGPAAEGGRGLKPIKKTKTGPSTDAATLASLRDFQGDQLAGLMLQYRELAKLKSTYVDALPDTVGADGRIHTSYHQAVASTGRLSSNKPNLQNIPIRTEEGRRIRRCFVAKPGHRFLSIDYSQVELRILAHFCGEGPLVEAFRAGEDIHRRTAAEVFGVMQALVTTEQRRAAKAINFGIVYGMSAFRLARDLRIPQREAKRYMDEYFARYPQVKRFMSQSVERAREKGYAETLWGRRRQVHGLDQKQRNLREAAERIAINTPVQGTAADVIKVAMIRVHALLAERFPETKLLLQVHDELVLEVPEAELERVREAVCAMMADVGDFAVPLAVESGDGTTWDAAH